MFHTPKLPVVASDLNKVTLHSHTRTAHWDNSKQNLSLSCLLESDLTCLSRSHDRKPGTLDRGLLDLRLVSVACFWEEHQIAAGCKQRRTRTAVSLETLGGSAEQQVHRHSGVLRRPRFITPDLHLKWLLIGRLLVVLIMVQSTETTCQLRLPFNPK